MLSNIISNIAVAAILGLGVSASPVANPDAPSAGGQVAFKFPLKNGFPNIKAPSAALTAIQKQAHGSLPNGPLPSSISEATATIFQVIASQDSFETAFFTSLIKNITDRVPGYEVGNSPGAKRIALNALNVIVAQEQLHALGANYILANTNHTTIAPCEYVFPVSDFDSAIDLAATVTEVVLGTLQSVQNALIANGDGALVPFIGSILGQEGEQTGAFRAVVGKVPSSLPFLTGSSAVFAYSALQQFVVPGSCPNEKDVGVPILPALTVEMKKISPKTTSVNFSFKKTGTVDCSKLSLVYINQQNVPVVEQITNVKETAETFTFTAAFPYAKNLMNGLTIAAVTNSAGPFANPDAVSAAAVYGPGLIEIK